MLVGDRILTPIAREQCQRRREAAACAVTADKNTGAVDCQFRGVLMNPSQRRITIFDRTRKFCFRCEPIVNGQDN